MGAPSLYYARSGGSADHGDPLYLPILLTIHEIAEQAVQSKIPYSLSHCKIRFWSLRSLVLQDIRRQDAARVFLD